MSSYNNFVSDFPGRCAALLKECEGTARLRNREVTLMLCIAMPSIVVPLERLKGPKAGSNGARPGHPSADWQRFEQAKASLDQLFEQRFRGSPLWPDADSNSWSFGPVSDVSIAPDSWAELIRPQALGPDKLAKTVLDHVRNALAHGNVFTRGNPEIEQIILLSERALGTNKFNFLAIGPADFSTFLHNWLEFLREINLPVGVVAPDAEAAA